MTKNLILILLFASEILLANTPRIKPGAEGNGGAVVNLNGKIVNFGSTSFAIQNKELELPEVDFIITKLSEVGLDIKLWNKLYEIIRYSSDRKYYNTEAISEENYLQLIEEYKKTFQISDDHIIQIAAVTKKRPYRRWTVYPKGETFILPIFYQMDFVARATLLLHESLWLLDGNGEITLEKILKVERSFDDFARCSENCGSQRLKLYTSLLEINYGDTLYSNSELITKVLQQAHNTDLNNNSMPDLVNPDGSIDLIKLFGEKALDVAENYKSRSWLAHRLGSSAFGERYNENTFVLEARLHLFKLGLKYPESHLINLLLEVLSRFNFMTSASVIDFHRAKQAHFYISDSTPVNSGISKARVDFRKPVKESSFYESGFLLMNDSYNSSAKANCKMTVFQKVVTCSIPNNFPRKIYLNF